MNLHQQRRQNASGEQISRVDQLKEVVIKDDTSLQVDFTFNLKMTINGQPQAIPANYGKSEDGRFIFNTDTTNGDVHVQSPSQEDYTLEDFFALWGGQFSSQCLLNHCLSGTDTIYMTVNDVPNNEYQDYVLQAGDQITIIYGTVPAPAVKAAVTQEPSPLPPSPAEPSPDSPVEDVLKDEPTEPVDDSDSTPSPEQQPTTPDQETSPHIPSP